MNYICVSDNDNPYYNLAAEEYLAERYNDGKVLFLWQNRDSVVIGKNQNAYAECRVGRLASYGIKPVRRKSGGGAVYHDMGNLNFTFICDENFFDKNENSEIILSALSSLGINAYNDGRNDLVLSDGRKISGSAYYKIGRRMIHHGTLLVSTDIGKMTLILNVGAEKLSSKHIDSVKARVADISEANPDITIKNLSDRIICEFAKANGEYRYIRMPDKNTVSDKIKFLSDTDFIFGVRNELGLKYSKHFDWGNVTIEYTLQDSIIRDCRIYSDSLDISFAKDAEKYLRGIEYNPDVICEAFSSASPEAKEFAAAFCLII